MPTAAALRSLTLNRRPVLTGLPANALVEEVDGGAFITLALPRPSARTAVAIGCVPGVQRWSAVRRKGEPFWMLPVAGTDLAHVPVETQALHLRFTDGSFGVVIPLVQSPARCALRGAAGGTLEVMLETGDARTVVGSFTAVYIGVGDDLHALMEHAARAVSARLGSGRLRRDKPLPAWVEGFGWCTWDAFYQEVDQAKVRSGLESFRALGVMPRMMILDDGWQSEAVTQTGERRLTAFAPNRKFSGDLGPIVRMAKDEFGLGTFMVWHAFQGYWGGVDPSALPGYRVAEQSRGQSPYMYQECPSIDEWWGPAVGVVHPDDVARFYRDYHRTLAAQGVDGVKVDNQAAIEAVAQGLGGRVRLMQAFRAALEGSAAEHFQHNVINCMSCSNDMLYAARDSTITRTSTDFWPKRPESHGLHLWTNALVSLWFAEFVHPDWDMLQSTHPAAWFHAAARAISGSPIYVSDKPGMHDGKLLRALTLSDGSILRCSEPAKPASDCVFHDLQTEDVPLTLVNRTTVGGVVGCFNVQYHAEAKQRKTISGGISPKDVPGLEGTRFAVYLQQAETVTLVNRTGRVPVALKEGDWELARVVAISDGCAPFGLADKLNGSAAITATTRIGKTLTVDLRDGGRFVAYAAKSPLSASVAGKSVKLRHDAKSGLLSLTVPGSGATRLTLTWG